STTLLQKKNTSFTSAADLSGKTIGSVVGFNSVPEMQGMEGVTEVKLYEVQDSAIRDVLAGRIDVAFLDPTMVEYALAQNPSWDLHQTEFVADSRYAIMSAKYSAVIGVNPNNDELYNEINRVVSSLWATCGTVKAMAKYGLGA